MTRKQLELREKANYARYINKNRELCLDIIMELFSLINQIGGCFKGFYRYRKLCKEELQSLQNETIFMRWPATYDDIEDCTPIFDSQEIIHYIFQKNHCKCDPYLLKNYVDIFEKIKENSQFKEKIEDIRSMGLIACFTERIDNDEMWVQYAKNETGMCLAYNSLSLIDFVKKQKNMDFMPVRYVENRDKCKDIMLNHYDLLENRNNTNDKYTLTCMTKDKSRFSFEEEWRLIFAKEKDKYSNKIGECIPFINPEFIIYGKNIDKKSDNYFKLKEITKNKNIKLI